ncbi:acyltransferase family protein [Vagococcus humatus]|uniref:acyltransferase family protein n=1 Tax=Vagococcus humatus TaxID=1889241 RepID=UPI00140309A2|nr:acyltransferase family protein [Vagococcus humatus]
MAGSKKRYIGGLDGLRAIAILLVLAYHFHLPFVRGGFIGVDIFFVLSGYLITSHLLIEWNTTKTFDLKKFWLKRIRRLIPAVFFMIIVTLCVSFLVFPESVWRNLKDGVAAFFYVSNWWYIFEKVPYFDLYSVPTPLKHLWSLAIEEQFYIFWPLILLGALKLLKKRQHVLKLIVGGIMTSAILMAVLYEPTSIDRVYYGTDTRAFALLIGCGLAFVWPYYLFTEKIEPKARRVLDGIGVVALVSLLMLANRLNEYQAFLYYGGFFLVACLTAILLAVLVHPSTWLGKLLALPPFTWLGKRSYSIYLWHYPVVTLFTPVKSIGTFHPWLMAGQLGMILLLSTFSFYFVEEPIRRFGWQGAFKERKLLAPTHKKTLWVMVVSLLIGGVSLFIGSQRLEASYNQQGHSESKLNDYVEKTQPKQPKPEVKIPVDRVLIVGDSIILRAKEELEKNIPQVRVDGKVGRQLVDAVDLLNDKYKDYNNKRSVVFIELGSNSPFDEKELTKLLAKLNQAHVFLINTRVPRNWETEVNQMLAQGSDTHPNVTLLDWHSAALNAPGLLEPDGIHLNQEGVKYYIQMITQALEPYQIIEDKVEKEKKTDKPTEESGEKASES